MPYHTNNKTMVVMVQKKKPEKKEKKEKKEVKMPEPMFKPRKDLSKRQKDLMSTHKEHHTKEHLMEMRKLMKKGYCFEQAHELAMKIIGK